MSIDWSKAPEGATHAHPPSGDWYRLNGAQWEVHYRTGAWQRALWINERLPECVSRDSDWNGEGLPPVGTDLEAGFACEEFDIWHKGTCVAVGEDPEGREEFCVVQFGKVLAMYTTEGRRMRPIRTAEQIAAEERKTAVEEMVYGACGCDPDGCNTSAYIVCGLLYDAGYRKQEAAQ